MEKQQHEQIKLYEQYRIIYNEVKSLSEESQTIVKNALGEICDIEMAWGILCSIDVAKYNNKINEEEALELIQWWEDNSSLVYIKEMKKDLKFINEGENTMSKMKTRGFEIVSDNHRKSQEEIVLPTRGTSKSAGYDFYSPINIQIQPNEKVCIWSDVKAYMQEGEVLLLFVRSSIGIKRGLRLSNSTGVIDSDYFSNEDNDGNIGIALHNYTDKVVTIEKGERVCQGVFVPFLVADNGNTDTERNGGIGSTN